MSTIHILGDQLLHWQETLGIPNPKHLQSGLQPRELESISFLADIPFPSDLHQIYEWRNGAISDPSVPMTDLWTCPGFFMLSVYDAIDEKAYWESTDERWLTSWIPLFSDGAAGRFFYDSSKVSENAGPVFYLFPDSNTICGKIYDSIEKMLATWVRCYEEGAFFVGPHGYLDSIRKMEVRIAMDLNRVSDYWTRQDL